LLGKLPFAAQIPSTAFFISSPHVVFLALWQFPVDDLFPLLRQDHGVSEELPQVFL